MATNPTKILVYDLDPELGKIFDSLKRFQGSYTSLYDRLLDLGSDVFTTEITSIIDDLVAGHENGGVLTIQRIENLKTALEEAQTTLQGNIEDTATDLQEQIDEVEAALKNASVIESQRYEVYGYDTGGNVVTETAYTDHNRTLKIYEVTYTYNNPTDAVLQSSQKKVYDTDGTTLLQTVNKTYEYNASGDITGVNTTIV